MAASVPSRIVTDLLFGRGDARDHVGSASDFLRAHGLDDLAPDEAAELVFHLRGELPVEDALRLPVAASPSADGEGLLSSALDLDLDPSDGAGAVDLLDHYRDLVAAADRTFDDDVPVLEDETGADAETYDTDDGADQDGRFFDTGDLDGIDVLGVLDFGVGDDQARPDPADEADGRARASIDDDAGLDARLGTLLGDPIDETEIPTADFDVDAEPYDLVPDLDFDFEPAGNATTDLFNEDIETPTEG